MDLMVIFYILVLAVMFNELRRNARRARRERSMAHHPAGKGR